jgi:prepilin-type N-terminal cleavage/methylation domain-containing protein
MNSTPRLVGSLFRHAAVGVRCNPRDEHRNRRRRQAFSLVEVLVVISIVTLLIALLLPALASARITSNLVQSLSNQRQVTVALLTYAEASKSSMPFSLINYGATSWNATWGCYTQSVPGSWGWTLFSQGYVSNMNLYWGPGRDLSNLDTVSMRTSGSIATGDWYYLGYAANPEALTPIHQSSAAWQVGINGNKYPGGLLPMRLNDSKTPPHDRFMLLCEVWNNLYPAGPAGQYRIDPATIWTTQAWINNLPFSYNGSVPRSFLDGHCISDPGQSMGWNPWALSPAGSTYSYRYGPRAGNWVYTSPAQFLKVQPWYFDYRK